MYGIQLVTVGTDSMYGTSVLRYSYCSKKDTREGVGRERDDTHTEVRTRTGAEQNNATAQTPTPARTEQRPKHPRVRPAQARNVTWGSASTNRDHKRPDTSINPPAPRIGHLSQKESGTTLL